MMQPMNGLTSQLAMCCGLGRRRDGRSFMDAMGHLGAPGYYYSPSMAQLQPGGTWPMAGYPQAQPYLLLTQPVIIANNPAAATANGPVTNQLPLFHQSTTGPLMASASPSIAIAGQHNQPGASFIASQYAIYNPTNGTLNVHQHQQQQQQQQRPTAQYQSSGLLSLPLDQMTQNRSAYFGRPQPVGQQPRPLAVIGGQAYQQTGDSGQAPVPLTADIFKKLEVIEKQVDLSRDMELIERHGIVITRALEPASLTPHLTEAMLSEYQSQFLRANDDHVIRFIEIIKRPGQTLGLYIRSVQFEDIQTRTSRQGLVITRIESDSPVYNSQVLHVGDEIISINLVEVLGMNLDDVVIIMSIPKRLVLALRISRERDQLLKSNLIQQQASLMRDTMMQNTNQADFDHRLQQQQQHHQHLHLHHQANQSAEKRPMFSRASGQAESYMQQLATDSELARARFQSGPTNSATNTTVPDEEGHALFHARPARVHSGLHLDEVPNTSLLEEGTDKQLQLSRQERPDLKDFHSLRESPGSVGYPSRFDQVGPMGLSGVYNSPMQQRNRKDDYISMKADLSLNRMRAGGPGGQVGGGRMGHIDRQLAISSSIDDGRLDAAGPSRYQTNYALDQELAILEREAMNKDRQLTSQLYDDNPMGALVSPPPPPPRPSAAAAAATAKMSSSSSSASPSSSSSSSSPPPPPLALVASMECQVGGLAGGGSGHRNVVDINTNTAKESSESSTTTSKLSGLANHLQTATSSSATPSNLPRRTLPTIPDLGCSPGMSSPMNILASPPSIKQANIISNIRLGQTPEQSSYFSSSIDAINRELKELRRQRMALSNNEPTSGSQIT